MNENEEEAEEREEENLEELLKFNRNWDEIGFFEKLQFFNMWFIVSIIGSFF